VARGRCRSIWIVAVLVLGPWLGCRLHRAAPPPALGELVIELPQAERGASGAVIFLESAMDPGVQDTGRLIEIVSEGQSFQAPTRVIQSGDRIRFVNQGPVAHRIFVTDEAGRRERQISPRAHSAELPITRPGEHRFYCSLHPDESVLLFATPSSHFVIPNGESRHTIDGLVAGIYQVACRSAVRAMLLEPGLPAFPRSDVTTP
jgi:plastocyanin